MEMIKYKISDTGHCFTDCPHVEKNNKYEACEDMPIKVGSLYCKLSCPYFVKVFEDEQIVQCSYVNDKGVELK